MINGILRCILSSRSGFKESVEATENQERGDRYDVQYTSNMPLADPSVLALWNGTLSPLTADHITTGLPFETNSQVIDFGTRFLRTGYPTLYPESSFDFITKCIERILEPPAPGAAEPPELYATKMILRRVDTAYDPSAIQYKVEEVCYGPHQKWPSDARPTDLLPRRSFMFGTGFSSTLGAEVVQIAGQIVEELATELFLRNNDEEPSTEANTAGYYGLQLNSATMADFLRRAYMGYVHLRAAELRRPVFAVLCCVDLINSISAKAALAGAKDGAERDRNVFDYGGLLVTINRLSYGPEGEPLRRLVEPYLVRYLS